MALSRYLPEYMQNWEQFTSQWIGVGAATLAAALYLARSRPTKFKCDVELSKQSVIFDEEERIHISPLCKDGKLVEYLYEDVRTQHQAFLRGLKVSNNGNCLGQRIGPGQPYKWYTYQQILDRARNFGSGLVENGCQASNEQMVGIYSQNRVEWGITEQACNAYSMVIVPLYDTLGPQAMRYIVQLCNLDIVVVDKNVKAISLLKDEEIKLKVIVLMEEPNEELLELSKDHPTNIITFDKMEEAGANNPVEFKPATPDDLHTICFTSGTTGNPKGVMLKHRTVIANAAGLYTPGGKSFTKITASDVYLSYLPLAHMMEKILQCCCFTQGACIGFFQGDVKLLTDDAACLKPTIFPMVPRLMNKIYDKIRAGVATSSAIKRFLFNKALNSKLSMLHNGEISNNTIWDYIVFRKIQAMLGGRVRICVTGAAPISAEVINFMRCALGVALTEGYGQTEVTAATSCTLPGDYKGGNVGTILPCNLVKLIDVAEKEYFAKDGKGEVCVKGPNVFQGYYNDEAKTNDTKTEDGWVKTGDIGTWLPNGSLKIFDRSKHIFKLSQGEYVAPEKIEQTYIQAPPISQVFIHGVSLKSCVVGVAVLDPDVALGWCAKNGVKCTTLEELSKSDEANKIILDEMNKIARKRGLKSFELAKKIFLETDQFTPENDLLTPTFKAKRVQLLKKYQTTVDKLYEGLE